MPQITFPLAVSIGKQLQQLYIATSCASPPFVVVRIHVCNVPGNSTRNISLQADTVKHLSI